MGTFRFKSDLRNHQAIVQPRLYDSAMVTQIILRPRGCQRIAASMKLTVERRGNRIVTQTRITAPTMGGRAMSKATGTVAGPRSGDIRWQQCRMTRSATRIARWGPHTRVEKGCGEKRSGEWHGHCPLGCSIGLHVSIATASAISAGGEGDRASCVDRFGVAVCRLGHDARGGRQRA